MDLQTERLSQLEMESDNAQDVMIFEFDTERLRQLEMESDND